MCVCRQTKYLYIDVCISIYIQPKDSACVYRRVTPEGSGVMVNGLLVTTAVFKEVGVVVVDFGIVRQSLDTRAETRGKREMKRRKAWGDTVKRNGWGKAKSLKSSIMY